MYLWWARLAGHDGLSAVHRPGVPALVLVLQGLGLRPAAGIAALECVLGVSVGLGAAALVRSRPVRPVVWGLAGVLAGTFAVHLAAGYLATLAFAALFLAAAAALALETPTAAVAGAGLLGAAGLAHPLFFPVGLLILAITAGTAWRRDRSEALRVGAAGLGGAVILGAGLLALLAGPGPLAVDTSKDGFLRRAGMSADLRSAYFDRFVHRWTRYVEWASLPLAVAGLRETGGFSGRFLRAWGITFVAGVAVGLATGLLPADRVITFGYVVPVLAALGLVRLGRALRDSRALDGRRPRGVRRAGALALAGGLTVAMLAGSFIAWNRQTPFLTSLEVERVATAGRYAAAMPPGTPLLFRVDTGDASVTFFATQAANAIRASLPPDRIRDVYVVVPPYDATPTADSADLVDPVALRQRVALTDLYAADADAALRAHDGGLLFDLAPFDRPGFGAADGCLPVLCAEAGGPLVRVAKGVEVGVDHLTPLAAPQDPLEPTSPSGIATATLATFALLVAAGYGWARAATDDPIGAAALSPALGAAALILAAIALERLGASLPGLAGATAASALGGGGGYLALAFVPKRRAAAEAPHEV